MFPCSWIKNGLNIDFGCKNLDLVFLVYRPNSNDLKGWKKDDALSI